MSVYFADLPVLTGSDQIRGLRVDYLEHAEQSLKGYALGCIDAPGRVAAGSCYSSSDGCYPLLGSYATQSMALRFI